MIAGQILPTIYSQPRSGYRVAVTPYIVWRLKEGEIVGQLRTGRLRIVRALG